LNKLLSQDEVDSLLKGLDTGDIATEKKPAAVVANLEVFDWATQGRNIRLNMPLLDVVNSRFSQKFRGSLSSSLRKMVDVAPDPLEIVKFNEFQRALPVPTSMHLFRMDPLRGVGFLVIEGRLVFSLVEAYFGGSGTGSTKIEGREFTPIEKKIIEKVVQMALIDLMESWEDVHPIKTEFIRSESNPLVVNVIPPEELLLCVRFGIELNKPLGSITVCAPYSSFQPIRHKLSGSYRDEDAKLDQFWVNNLRNRLIGTEVDMTVDLGRTQLSVKELVNLKVGDIVVLDNKFKSGLIAKVEDIPKFDGYIGRYRNRKVYRVENPIFPQG
jgi:flagellar motor switch protein FliM